ncbi:MAG TPA: hypothetical protein VHT34_14750 [Clostridia bacterium]|nr:hypothetical protein [Clostridia bacterium]
MKIEINKKTTTESLELDVLTLKEELYRMWEVYASLEKRVKELTEKLVTKGVL